MKVSKDLDEYLNAMEQPERLARVERIKAGWGDMPLNQTLKDVTKICDLCKRTYIDLHTLCGAIV